MTVFNFIFLELGKQRGQIDGEAFSFGEERFGGLFDLGLGDGFFGGVGDGVKSLGGEGICPHVHFASYFSSF